MDVIESLKLLNEESDIRKELDKFIEEGHQTFKKDWSGKNDWEKNKYFKILESDFNNFVIELGAKYPDTKLTKDCLTHYFMFDKRISSKMRRYTTIGTNWGISFDANLYRYGVYAINGSNIQDIYTYQFQEMINTFESIADLLPLATKKYILNKKKEMENLSLDSLENEFQARIFVSKMEDKFKITKYRDILKNFNKIKDKEKRFATLINLYSAVDKKYDRNSEKEGETIIKFLDSIAEAYLKNLNYTFYYSLTGPNVPDTLKKFIGNANFCNSFARVSRYVDFTGHLPMLSYLISSGQTKEKMKYFVIEDMKKKTNGNYVDFKSVDDENLDLFFDLAKSQFLNKHTELNQVLSEEERICV